MRREQKETAREGLVGRERGGGGGGGGGGRQERQDERTVEHQCHKMHRKDHGLFLLAKSGNVWILRVDSTKIHDETILAI